ncbi:LptA/OstA family protein, partial [bacterium]
MKVCHIICIVLLSCSLLTAADSTFWRGSSKILGKSDSLSIYEKGNKAVLRGRVRITKEDMKVYSKKATIYQKEKKFTAEKNVNVKRSFKNGNNLDAKGDKLIYYDDKQLSKMYNVKSLDFFMKEKGKTINLKSDTVTIQEHKEILDAQGNVFIVSPFEEVDKSSSIVRGNY